MSLNDREAWIEQAKAKVMRNAKAADSFVEEELINLYAEAGRRVETEINAMYAKYAKDNELTDAEASKLLSDEEYSKWKKSIAGYVAEAEEDPKILQELNTLAMKSRISRKEQLLSNIYQNIIDMTGECETKVTELLGDLLKTNYYQSCHTIQSNIGLGFNVAKINDTLLKQVLEYPWSGNNYSKNLWDNTDKLAALAKREITLGFISGSSVQKMAKGINDIMGKGMAAAERVVRTEGSYFANQGEIMSYKEMGIEKYQFLGGGCEDCRKLNGIPFSVAEAEAGTNLPPIHPNCKCTTTAYFQNSLFAKRDDTNPLDSNVKFEEWKKKYVDSQPEENIIELSDDEQYALNHYIGSKSYLLNEKIRKNSPLSDSERKLMKDLDSALDKMPEHKGTLYRSVSDFGIEDVDEFVQSYQVGKKVSFPAYTSTSTEVYDEKLPIQYVIQSKHGKDIRAYNAEEKEILFKRESSFYVTKVDGHTIYLEEEQ